LSNQRKIKRYQIKNLQIIFLWLKWFIKIEHDERLDLINRPILLAFNHNNYFETLMIAIVFLFRMKGQKVTFMVDWMYGKLPVIGWFVNQIEPVLVYNKKASLTYLNRLKPLQRRQTVLAECLQRLRDNCSIGIFPEGTRNPDPYNLRRGRQGVGELALQARVPVVPVGVDFPARHRLGRVPAFGRLVLRIGKPLTFPVELAACDHLLQDTGNHLNIKKKLERFFAARVTHAIMMELSHLAGKTYPFARPVPPPEAHAYFNSERGSYGTN
jgi:1-acyl-sn-glycerol-3-phosphate acyltransferase